MRKIQTVIVLLAICVLALSARAAIFLHVEGIRGDAVARSHAGAITVLKFNLELIAGHEAGGGGASGRIIQKPLTIIKELDAASPQFIQALTTHEILKSVSLHLLKPDGRGAEETYYIVHLHNASVSSVRQFTDDAGHNVEEVGFAYEKLEIEVPGATPPPRERDHDVIRIPIPGLK